ncbi:hypothetical protein D3C81_1033490 [compost metagenome]
MRPDFSGQGGHAGRAEQQGCGQLLHGIEKHQGKCCRQGREDNRQGDPAERRELRCAKGARRFFKLRRCLVQCRAYWRLGQRQKQQGIGQQQQSGGLVQSRHVMQGEIHQSQGDHQAGQGVQQVGQTLGPDRQTAFVAHHEETDRQRQQQAQACATQRQ